MNSCRTADLTITLGQSNGAAGSTLVDFELQNQTDQSCEIDGYFGLQLLGAEGEPVAPPPSEDAGLGSSTAAAPEQVTLVSKGTATFEFEWGSEGNSCSPAKSVELTAPGQTDQVQIPALTSDGVTIAPCGNGETSEGPVRAG